MTSLSLRRAGASVLVLEVCYLLLLQLASVLLAVDSPEPDRSGPGAFLAVMAAAVVLLLWAAALLGLPALMKRVPRWTRAVVLVGTAALQLYVVRGAAANALDQGLEPDAVLNALMVLCALVATAACVRGLRAPAGRTPTGSRTAEG
ncbi:hypothetical protein [Streptomyces sp. NPDC059247]|uniref:hypothetical protein n=1 Tax=Streptomyces sp. NPDC059247 TaxID=3346790 RepID=UPI003680F674